MRHKNSFPPRLTANESAVLTFIGEGATLGQLIKYSGIHETRRLVGRGLIFAANMFPKAEWHWLEISYHTSPLLETRFRLSRRGELTLSRYRIDNGIRELAKLTRKAA